MGHRDHRDHRTPVPPMPPMPDATDLRSVPPRTARKADVLRFALAHRQHPDGSWHPRSTHEFRNPTHSDHGRADRQNAWPVGARQLCIWPQRSSRNFRERRGLRSTQVNVARSIACTAREEPQSYNDGRSRVSINRKWSESSKGYVWPTSIIIAATCLKVHLADDVTSAELKEDNECRLAVACTEIRYKVDRRCSPSRDRNVCRTV